MDDLIYRSAAIDALGEKPLAWTESEYEHGLQDQWEQDVDALMALPATQRWVPVTEPPEKKGYYLAHLDDGSMEVALWAEHHYFGKFEWRCSNWKEVTHWMPLPEPPKEEP